MLSRASILIGATCLGVAVLLGAASGAIAQMSPPGAEIGPGMALSAVEFDPAQLPEFKGKVAQYTLSPRGIVDGLILADGTEVKLSPRLSTALVFSIKPGDQVSIRGLKARDITMVVAVTITNTANGAVVGGESDMPHLGRGPRMEVSGKVKSVLHTQRGDVSGALLEDGTVVRLPPHEAEKFADLLKVGESVSVRGVGVSNALGKAVLALEIGASADKLTKVMMHMEHHPGDGPGEMMHGPMGGPQPRGDAPPPPAR